MSFKLVVFCASMAVISCAHIDSREHIEIQKQHAEDIIQRQSEKIREHHELEQHQKQMQQQQLDEQIREQEQKIQDFEQKIRDDVQERKDRVDGDYFYRYYQPTAFIAFHQVPIVYQPRNDDSNYNFAYTVSDMSTGDHKSHQETRRGDQVQGQYKLMDSDGYQRIVNYRANDRDGFDAEVRREPITTLAQHHQTQQNYARHHNHQVAGQNYFFTQHPKFYTSTFSKNDH